MHNTEGHNEKYLFDITAKFDETKQKTSSIEVLLTREYSAIVKGWIQDTAVFIRDQLGNLPRRVSCKMLMYRKKGVPVFELNINTVPQFTVIILINGELDLSQRYEKIHNNYCTANIVTIKSADFVDAFHIARLLLKYVEPETSDPFGDQLLFTESYIEKHEQIQYEKAIITPIRSLPPQQKYVTYLCPHCKTSIARIKPTDDIRSVACLDPFMEDIIELKIQNIIPVKYQRDKISFAFAKKLECGHCKQLYMMFQTTWGHTNPEMHWDEYMKHFEIIGKDVEFRSIFSENSLINHPHLEQFWLSSLLELRSGDNIYEHTFGPFKIEGLMRTEVEIRSQCMSIIDKAWPIIFL